MTVYTPGSTAGVPLDVIGSLRAPTLSWETEAETLRDEIEGTVTSLLSLVGIAADPLSSREHVLLSNLVEHAWRAGRDLDLGTLIGRSQTAADPQARRLRSRPVLPAEGSHRARAAAERARRVPAVRRVGRRTRRSTPQSLLFTETGAPRCAIVYLAHLSDAERQFVVTLVFSKLVTWMRGAERHARPARARVHGRGVRLRAAHREPPTKQPILTIVKQGRAFGLGLVLSTQNPVDLDYKAMSNAGTWLVGRLQTENDKARVLEGLRSAAGDDRRGGARQGARRPAASASSWSCRRSPRRRGCFTTRWAMSYLRGPLTKERGATARARRRRRHPPLPRDRRLRCPASLRGPGTAPAAADDGATLVAPSVAKGVPVAYVDPAAPWAATIGSSRAAPVCAPRSRSGAACATTRRRQGSTSSQEWEAILPLDGAARPGAARRGRLRRSRSRRRAAGGRAVRPAGRPAGRARRSSGTRPATPSSTGWSRPARSRSRRTPSSKLWSRPGESPEAFARRCVEAADTRADAETAKLTDKLGIKRDRLESALRTAQERMSQAQAEASSRKQRELVTGAGAAARLALRRPLAARAACRRWRSPWAAPPRTARADAAAAEGRDATDDLAVLEQELADGDRRHRGAVGRGRDRRDDGVDPPRGLRREGARHPSRVDPRQRDDAGRGGGRVRRCAGRRVRSG